MSVAALVLGIISLFIGGLIGLLIGVLALVFAFVSLANKTGKRGLSIAGLVCGLIGTIYNLVVVISIL